MILEILTYTHNITTMLFGIFLSAFFLGDYIWSAYLCWVRR